MTRALRLTAAGLACALLYPCAATADFKVTLAKNAFGTFRLVTESNGEPNRFDIDFFADRARCEKVLFIQTAKLTFKNGGAMVMKPGDAYKIWKYRDKNTISDGTFVDQVATSADPYTNGDDDPEDYGTPGLGIQSDARWHDTPTTGGFWPVGKTSTVWEFEICATCAAGDQAGVTYGCVTWKLEETKGKDPGTATVTSGDKVKPPSASFRRAVDLFEENHINERHERYCPEIEEKTD